MSPRRRVACVVAWLIWLGLAASCSSPARAPGTLVIGIGTTLNLGANNPVLLQRNANVWETLTELDEDLAVRPGLADAWDVSSDGRRWTLHLRPGIRFHDGRPVDAAAVVTNLTRLRDHQALDYYSTFTYLASATADDASTVRLTFTRPAVALPVKLGHYFAGIFSPAAIGADGKLTAVVGSGPYRYAESRVGEFDRVVANPDYRSGRPAFDTVEFRIIPDPTVRVMALVRGDVDVIAHHGGVPATHVAWLRDQPGIEVASQDVAITHYLLFNNASPPFDTQGCREAFDRMLDRAGLVASVLGGAGTPADDFLIPRARAWHRGRFSVTPATSMTVEACRGARPLRVVLSQGDATSWGYRQLAEAVGEQARRHGLDLAISTLEGGAWQAAIEGGQFDLTLYPLSAPTGTPELLTRRLAYSRGMRVRGIGNSTHYASPEADRLFDAAVFAPDVATQTSTFNALLDLLADDRPFVPLYHERYFYAFKRGLTGVRVDPFLKIDLSGVRRGTARP